MNAISAYTAPSVRADVPVLLPGAVETASSGASTASGDAAFAEKLQQAIGSVDHQVTAADHALFGLASGTEVDIHGAMIALEEAEIGLKAMVSVRDKVMAAYEQLLNLAI